MARFPTDQAPAAVNMAFAVRAGDEKAGMRVDTGMGGIGKVTAATFASVTPLELPTDRPRSLGVQVEMGMTSSRLDADLCHSIRQLAGAEQVEVPAIFVAAYLALLRRYSGQDEIAIGCTLTTVSGSGQTSSANSFPVHEDLSDDPSFRALVLRLQGRQAAKLTSDSTGEESGRTLEAVEKYFGGRAPAWISYRSVISGDRSESGEPRRVLENDPLYMGLAVDDRAADITLHLFYNTSLYTADSANRTLISLQVLLSDVIKDSACELSRLRLLTSDEERRILVDWNRTDTDYAADKALHELVSEQAKKYPESIAIACGKSQVTYAEFDRHSNQLAHFLQKRGIGPDARVGICLAPSVEFAFTVLAVLKVGGACVPLDPKYPSERLAYMLQDVGAKIVVTERELLGQLPPPTTEVAFYSEALKSIHEQPTTEPKSEVRPDDPAYVIYTSGSTGNPRGVVLTHRGLVNYNVHAARSYSMTREDRVLQFCSVSFDIAVEELFITWLSGATLVLRTNEMPLAIPEFLEWISRERITVLDLPTAYWHEWVHHLEELNTPAPTALRLVVVGGEKASSAACGKWLKAVGKRVRWINTYGPTETSICATAFEPDFEPGEPLPYNIPIGRALPNVRTYLLDQHMAPVPIGVPGELHIGGVGVARGYLNRPDLTKEKFVADPFASDSQARLYKTGDLARYLPSGDIEFLGRRDNQVKIRGFRVELGEVEVSLIRHSSLREAAVVVTESEEMGKQIVAFYVCREGASAAASELRQFLTGHLPDYMVPSSFIRLESLPLTPNGKVDRRSLSKTEVRRETSAADLPLDSLQVELRNIWQEVLKYKPAAINDNFFEVGGQSLLAARLMHRLGRKLGKPLPISLLFEAPTIEQLSRAIRKDYGEKRWSCLVAIQPLGTRPPFFCVHGVGGNVLGFRQLAQLMKPDYPFYGLQAQGLDGRSPCFTQVQDMAAHYISELKKLQSRGPYFIGGYSFGGMVAYEMAQQLSANGDEVGLLALLDTYPRNLKSMTFSVLSLVLHPSRLRVRSLPGTARKSLARRIKGLLLSSTLKQVLRTNGEAADRYVFQPYFGRTTLFRASETSLRSHDDHHSAWKDLAAGGLDVREIAGDHGGILVEPQVSLLAKELKECIDLGVAHADLVSQADQNISATRHLEGKRLPRFSVSVPASVSTLGSTD